MNNLKILKNLWLKTVMLSLLSFFGLTAIYAKEYHPSDVYNPNIKDRRVYVADPERLIGSEATAVANETLWNLRKSTGAEVVLVVVPNTGHYSREEFAVKLFDDWKVGKSDKDNGVIILIVPDQREAWIATGYGVEGVIPDVSAAKIINRSVVPYMKNGDLDGAVKAVTKDVANVLSNPEAAEELKSSKKEAWEEGMQSDISEEDFINFTIMIVLVLFIIAFVKYFYDSRQAKKLDRYSQARYWYDTRTSYILLAVFSLGLGIIPWLLYRHKYKTARNKPLQCPTCRGKMKKLNEEEDNRFLSPSQDLEERLNSVDYDVWVCPDCGSVERFAFPNKFTQYEECPNCHTVAMSMVKDHIVTPATTRHTGIGERVYECKYCHHQKRQRYTIPKRSDGTAAAIAAGAILGSGSHGGGFGGGFGGGRTGGGGGGGRW
ncbi:MAG: TPM domain-containing protein [Muribaculaceae bacterium]|nr:TPM domain-containing protein [Muribaculaceae bacterium]